MNAFELTEIAGDRYLTVEERGRLRDYARHLEQAAQLSAAVEAAEQPAIESVLNALRERHWRFGQLQPKAWERLEADLRLVVRSDVQAFIRREPCSLDDSVLLYLKSIYRAYRLSPTFVRECFSLLADQLSGRLKSDEAAALRPYLERNVEVLGSIPQPAAAVV